MTIKQRALSRLVVLIIVIIMLPVMDCGLWSQEKEDLLFQEIPVVVTASRKEQPITEAPTTITVITPDDIRYSGATNIPDILRMVAGVDVMTITARDQQVGVRGFSEAVNNKLLVLVDGRSVYTDSYGHVLWDTFPVGLEEIDRIEVVKSPASSLYGANAFSGVINIITKSPGQLKGTTLHLSGGTRDTFIGSLLHAGEAAKKVKYKISTEWDRTDGWYAEEKEEKAREVIRVNALVEYLINEKSKLVFSAGRAHAKNRKMLLGGPGGTLKVNDKVDYFKVDFEYANLKFRAFLKSEKPDFEWFTTGEQVSWDTATYDAELLHSFNIGKKHSLIWGLNYRYNKLKKSALILRDYHQDLWALFLENDVKIADKFRFTLGGRYDKHPLVGEHFSPRGNIFYAPTKKQTIRVSLSKSFRNPSFLDSYAFFQRQMKITFIPPIEIPYTIIFRGNQNLKSEGIIAYEIGYQSILTNRFKLNLNLFYSRYNDFISPLTVVTFYGENEIFPGSPGGIFPKTTESSFQNRGSGWGIGGEINLAFSFRDGISGFVNYSFQQITDKDDDPSTPQINEKDRVRLQYPKNKLNAGLRIFFKNGISLNLLAHWVDKSQRLIYDSDGNTYLAPVDDYFIFNTRVGHTFGKGKVELALSIFNLFNDKHYEFPPGTDLSIPYSDRIGRRITFTLTVKF